MPFPMTKAEQGNTLDQENTKPKEQKKLKPHTETGVLLRKTRRCSRAQTRSHALP